MDIRFKKVTEGALPPVRAREGDAGMDLFYCGPTVILNPRSRVTLCTGIAMEIPRGFYGKVSPRSGLARDFGINVLGGVIDSGYRGEIKVILHNTGDLSLPVHNQDRIAQLIVMPCSDVTLEEVLDLSTTERGDGGFGSSGV